MHEKAKCLYHHLRTNGDSMEGTKARQYMGLSLRGIILSLTKATKSRTDQKQLKVYMLYRPKTVLFWLVRDLAGSYDRRLEVYDTNDHIFQLIIHWLCPVQSQL